MAKQLLYLLITSLFFTNSFSQTGVGEYSGRYFPGGVAGAEVWYITHHQDLENDHFDNHSQIGISISNCGDYKRDLLNFNHAIYADKLCLKYTAPLENDVSRNLYFVGKPVDVNKPFSHFTTAWGEDLGGLPQTGSIMRNRFDFSNKSSYVEGLYGLYNSNRNANVNFYHFNTYKVDKKYKSYGEKGETDFFIGREFLHPVTEDDQYHFNGVFPEAISFPFELNENQKNRVESYLALKYGLTLKRQVSYRNSRNLVFWNSSNNTEFPNNIFGIGRDDISSLNQLQGQSSHMERFLIASVGELMETNLEKQDDVGIKNDHFIVFGDNGANHSLEAPNDAHVRVLSKKWLSQSTGEISNKIPMYFWLRLSGELQDALTQNQHLKLWMLHDKFVNNEEVSDFNNGYVEFYDPQNPQDMESAIFEKIFFDEDQGIYDQFTFGVGPEMIVQAQFHMTKCGEKEFKTDIVITGGKPPYRIYIENNEGFSATYEIDESPLTIPTYGPTTYFVYVEDAQGLTAELEFDVTPVNISVDLGPDQTLTASMPEINLNAGINVNDPEATYQWYKDGELLIHYDPVLVVEEPGVYTVEITSGDRSCEATDTIKILEGYKGELESIINCETGTIVLSLYDGVLPYTTTVTGNDISLVQVHNETFSFTSLPYGAYTVNTVDSNGNPFQGQINLEDPYPLTGIALDLPAQAAGNCSVDFNGYGYTYPFFEHCSQVPYQLDASLLVTDPNATYEWFANDMSLGIYDPVVEINFMTENDPLSPQQPHQLNEYTVRVTSGENGCYITDGFVLKGFFVYEANNVADMDAGGDLEDQDSNEENLFTTVVYPNPSYPTHTFYYKITSNEVIEVEVEIFNALGAILYRTTLSGESQYTLPYSLSTEGVYFIKATSPEYSKTDQILITN